MKVNLSKAGKDRSDNLMMKSTIQSLPSTKPKESTRLK